MSQVKVAVGASTTLMGSFAVGRAVDAVMR